MSYGVFRFKLQESTKESRNKIQIRIANIMYHVKRNWGFFINFDHRQSKT